jgi:hypothetical protein
MPSQDIPASNPTKKWVNQGKSLFGKLFGLFSKRDLIVIATFAVLGAGGAFAATLITLNAPDSQGAGYLAATGCDEAVTINANVSPTLTASQYYVSTVSLSDISQNATTGCGNKVMELALKVNGQMTYASWDIPESSDNTFYFTSASSSLSNANANSVLTPFAATGLTNVGIRVAGSFTDTFTVNSDATRTGFARWRNIAGSETGQYLVIMGAYETVTVSTDYGVTWIERNPRLAGATQVAQSCTMESDGSRIWCAASSTSLWYVAYTDNYGVTWTQLTTTPEGNCSWVAPSRDGTILYITCPLGIYKSTNSGASWTSTYSGGGTADVRDVKTSDDGKYVLVMLWFQAKFVLWSNDYGQTFTQPSSLPATSSGGFSVDMSPDGKYMVVAGYIDGTATTQALYTSEDYGVTWSLKTYVAAGYTNTGVTISSDGRTITASSYLSITRSYDKGLTWKTIYGVGSRDLIGSTDGKKIFATSLPALNQGYRYTRSYTLN